MFAIVAGIIVAASPPGLELLRPGLVFSTKAVLQGSIVVLGLGLSFGQVVSTGESSLPVLVGTLVIALCVAWFAGRALHIGSDLNTLIGVGTAICGASAIAATEAVIGADEADVSYAIATIFTFNVVAVLSFPTLGQLLGLSQHAFGLWAGTAINDTSSVVAASTIYGHAAVSYAVVVKLTRALAIVPISLGLAAWRNRSADGPNANSGSRDQNDGHALATRVTSAGRPPPDLHRVVPFFVVAFLGAVALNTCGLVPATWHHSLSDLATWMITAALAAIGLSANLSHVRHAGPRPVLLGAVLWATAGIASLVLQIATRTI